MSQRTPKRDSFAAAVCLAYAWKNYDYDGGQYDGHMERFLGYNDETAKAILKGAKDGAKGAEKILYNRFMMNKLPADFDAKRLDMYDDKNDPNSFGFGYRLFMFCAEELNADKMTCIRVMEGFAMRPLKERKRLAANMPNSVGSIGFFTPEHIEWLNLFHSYGNLYFKDIKLEYDESY